MLTYFPTPYLGEWWYSVLCRYHVRSGYHNHATTIRELYGERRRAHGRLFPTSSCYAILEQLPQGLFDIMTILTEHTLLPFYLRFYPEGKKTVIVESLCTGKSSGVTSIILKTPEGKECLKYCSECYIEDMKQYGEPYWHREHQIPLMCFCPKHGTELKQIEIRFSRLSELFIPLSTIPPTKVCFSVPQSNRPDWIRLAEIMYDFLTMPPDAVPTPGYNNLRSALSAQEYASKRIDKKTSLDAKQIQGAVRASFGEQVAEQYFSKAVPAVIHRIGTWKLSSPERYALLCVIAKMSAKELFGPELVYEDAILGRLLELKAAGIAYKKNELAALMDISPSQLDSIAKKYSIDAFWKQISKSSDERRRETIRIMLTPEEKQLVLRAAAKSGNGQLAVFARTVLLNEVERIIEGGKTSGYKNS